MKVLKPCDDWSHKSHNEFVIFYSMCGKKDQAIFDAPSKNCSPVDSARLFFIALAFGFRKMALRIIANIDVDAQFLHLLDSLKGNSSLVIRWFDDFVEDIPIPEFKKIAAEVWGNLQKEIFSGDTNIENFFK